MRKLSHPGQLSLQNGPSVIEHQDRERQIALTLLGMPVIFAGVEKLSFARLLWRMRHQDEPVLVSAGPAEEAATARVVDG